MSSSQNKKRIRLTDWEKKMANIDIRKEDINQLVMDYFVVEGFKDAAESFQKEAEVISPIPLDEVEERMQIRDAIDDGRVDEAISRINDLDPEILDSNPRLYFHLQQQRMIELVRQGKIEEALQFAQDELANQGEESPEFLEELEETIALLAFNGLKDCPVNHLLEPIQKEKLATELNAAILSSQNHDRQPKLLLLLKVMLWSQQQLSERISFPEIKNLVTAELERK